MIALQRTDEFVGRTTNWLYDHLRFVPRYTPTVVCDRLANRQEFADLEALVGAERHERTDERIGYRNGTRTRTWDTRLGTIDLAIPKVRPGLRP